MGEVTGMTKESPTRRASEFGSYLAEARKAVGASVRTAAAQVGLSYGHLAKIERGEVRRPPSLHVLSRIAGAYRKPLDEVLDRAGVTLETTRPEDAPETGSEQFERLMLSPEYIPETMRREYLQHFPLLHRLLIRDLVAKVERHTVARVRWELREDDDDQPCPPRVSTRSYAEIIGAATVKERVNPDWKETT